MNLEKTGIFFIVSILCCLECLARQDKSTKVSDKTDREGKIFSLFTIVNFKNEPCVSTSQLSSGSTSYRNGTCFTSSECSSNGGSSKGSCAAGFGVCCVFTVNSASGNTINYNDTYIQNPGYPSTYGSTDSVTYTINKCSNNICKLRLDFETFTIEGTTSTSEGPVTDTDAAAGCNTCTDSFTVTVTTGQSIPVLCGQNTGQHIYIDIGSGSSNSATVAFDFGTTSSTSRQWDIKVAQIPCGSSYGPPDDCLQWTTGLTGRITTFNFLNSAGSHLNNQDYSHCIRQEQGYCCVQYTVCSDTSSWSWDSNEGNSKALVGTNCGDTPTADAYTSADYVTIEGSSGSCGANGLNNNYCGYALNPDDSNTPSINVPICDCTTPFSVGFVSDCYGSPAAAAATAVANRGVCLEYRQLPCNT